MERPGIAADVDHLAGAGGATSARGQATPRQAAYDVVGREFNLGSPKQLQELLFDELGLPKTKRTKTGYTTDSDALRACTRRREHPLLEPLLRHRDVAELKSMIDRRGLLSRRVGPTTAADPHDVQPDGRRDRPAVLDRPEPAEHPDPHRRGPPDPGGVRRRARATRP